MEKEVGVRAKVLSTSVCCDKTLIQLGPGIDRTAKIMPDDMLGFQKIFEIVYA